MRRREYVVFLAVLLAAAAGWFANSGNTVSAQGAPSNEQVLEILKILPLPYIIIGVGVVFLLVAVLPGGRHWTEWVGGLKTAHRLFLFILSTVFVAWGVLENRNHEPRVVLTIEPTQGGMQGLTEYTFDAGSSFDEDDDQLNYEWEFGDGYARSGAEVSHTYEQVGYFTVTVTVSDGKSSSARTNAVKINQNIDGSYFSYRSHGNVIDLDLSQADVHRDGEIVGAIARPIQWPTTHSGEVRQGQYLGDLPLIGGIDGSGNFVCPCKVRLSSNPERQQSYVFDGVLSMGAIAMSGEIRTNGIFEGRTDERVTYSRHPGEK